MEIKNFILLNYVRNEFSNMPNTIRQKFPNIDYKEYNTIQYKLLKQQIKRIKIIYPQAKIHVITNLKDLKCDGEKYFIDQPSNHLFKFQIYGLLNEPAMYLDNDIILLSKFKPEHLNCKNQFNLYSISNHWRLNTIAKTPLPININLIYNAGIVWINQPSKLLVQNLYDIHEKYFSDREKIMKQGRWADNDEFAVTFYALYNQFDIKLFKEVSANRNSIEQIKKYQSVHYTGFSIDNKKQCIKEYNNLYNKIYL